MIKQDVKESIQRKNKALRIVLTQDCIYNCNFCHKEGMKKYEVAKLTPEDYSFLFEVCKETFNWDEVTLTGGEGGILITNNKKIMDRALLLGHYNKRCKLEINSNDELYKYATTGKGMKLRAHPIAIRIANEYFKNIDKINSVKNKYANKIIKELKDIKGIEVLEPEADCKNSWYALIIKYDQEQMKGISRERFVEALHAEGAIEVDIPNSTCPLDSLELFKKHKILYPNDTYEFDYTDKFENAHKFYNNIIKIPIWYGEDEEEIIIKYIRAIKKVCNNIKELV